MRTEVSFLFRLEYCEYDPGSLKSYKEEECKKKGSYQIIQKQNTAFRTPKASSNKSGPIVDRVGWLQSLN